jgi:hypothetical protein
MPKPEIYMKKTVSDDTVAHFTWSFGTEFFLETEDGNFVWSDPDCGGTNEIRSFKGSYGRWCKGLGIPYGRDKGTHTVGNYCPGFILKGGGK